MPKWSWQKKQERTELDWAGAFARSLKGGGKRGAGPAFSSFSFLFRSNISRLCFFCHAQVDIAKEAKRGPSRGWIVTSYCCWVRSEIELLSGGFPTLFFRSKKGSHTFPSPQSSHFLTLTREGGHTFPAALFLPQNPPSHQHEHAQQLAPQGAQE